MEDRESLRVAERAEGPDLLMGNCGPKESAPEAAPARNSSLNNGPSSLGGTFPSLFTARRFLGHHRRLWKAASCILPSWAWLAGARKAFGGSLYANRAAAYAARLCKLQVSFPAHMRMRRTACASVAPPPAPPPPAHRAVALLATPGSRQKLAVVNSKEHKVSPGKQGRTAFLFLLRRAAALPLPPRRRCRAAPPPPARSPPCAPPRRLMPTRCFLPHGIECRPTLRPL